MTSWANCPVVERNPRKISGDWAFKGTRMPVYALFENLESGATVKEFIAWYPEVQEWQVAAVWLTNSGVPWCGPRRVVAVLKTHSQIDR